MPKGTETILLIEDDEAIRKLARLVLQSRGYQVLEARHGEEALAIGQTHPGPIDLVVTDMLMPHMGGRQVAQQLRLNRPNLRVLFMSGYAEDVALGGEAQASMEAFISKPFTALALASKVRQVLDGGTGEGG
jgi:two-component system cell cycle sensor histidine kinase/response regulator CckA